MKRFLFAFLTRLGLSLGLIAQGIAKQTIYKKQSALGTVASGAGGQVLRRSNSVFNLKRGTYESDEIVTHQQSTGVRLGMHSTAGKVTGLLSAGTYSAFLATTVRKDFVAGATTGALTNVTAAVTAGAAGTFTRAAGSYLTDGFKIGDVVRWTGWSTTGTANNTHNFLITALTATVMTVLAIDGVAVGAKASGDSVTCTLPGKKTLAPLTGHTDDIWTFEEWYPDLSKSEQYQDMKLNQTSVDLPASGDAKITLDFVGLKRTLNVSQQFTSPTAETTTEELTAVTGVLMCNGSQVTNVTGVQLSISENATVDGPVVGSNFGPDISRGRIKVTGQITAYFDGTTLQTLFANETNTSLVVVIADSITAAADFVALSMSRIKLTGDTPDDGEKGIVRTYPFTAELNASGGSALADDKTILSIQDSQAP